MNNFTENQKLFCFRFSMKPINLLFNRSIFLLKKTKLILLFTILDKIRQYSEKYNCSYIGKYKKFHKVLNYFVEKNVLDFTKS
jgi:hypothetical protein